MSIGCPKVERWVLSLGVLLLALGLAACDGDDGQDGLDGEDGRPASVDISNAEELNAEILGASVQSPPVVEFRLTDGNDNPVRGLPASAISFNFAKLVPGTNGNASAWQSYINTTQTASAPGAPGLGTSATQATTENGSAGSLVYDESTATYTYTFATDVANVTTPIPVAYQPSLTHRVTFEIRGFAPVDNPIYDFVPNGNPVSFTREIVDTETCNACHNDLALHGGARADTDECVACHNPGSTDPDSGNTVDMKVMIHKIHHGEELTNLPYQIWGFRNTLHDYSDVAFPQDIRNCSNCHDATNANTPDASNWFTVPTAEACGSCHDDVDFVSGANHPAGPATNDTCAGCHANPGLPGLEVRNVHSEPVDLREASSNYQLNILDITGGTPGAAAVATISVTNPNEPARPGEEAELGRRYNLVRDPIISDGGSRLRLTLAWNTEDYTNEGAVVPTGEEDPGDPVNEPLTEAQVARSLLIEAGALGPNVVNNGDRTYDVTLGVVPGGTEGSGAVTMEGRLNDPTLGRLAINSVVDYFPITDTSAEARRAVVSIIGCDRCHDVLAFHGSNRVNNDQVCVTCHNPNATDIDDRDATLAGTCDPATGTDVGVDGKCEQSIDFKYMIHGIHANNISIGGAAYFAIRYPQSVANCVACHESGTYYPDDDGPSLGSTIQSVDYGTVSDRTTGDDNIRITPWASVCSSCHVPDLERDDTSSTNPAKLHMIQNGASFALASGDPVLEVCSICHGPGKLADVGVVHGVED